jgi:hypothetical protein
MIPWLFNWVRHVTGADDGSGAWYLWWSGFVGDLVYVGLLAGFYRHVNCHVDGCKRIGGHHVPGTSFKVCRKHHPTGGNSAQTVLDAHAAAQQ